MRYPVAMIFPHSYSEREGNGRILPKFYILVCGCYPMNMAKCEMCGREVPEEELVKVETSEQRSRYARNAQRV